jgi:thymidylate synthase (FAD)
VAMRIDVDGQRGFVELVDYMIMPAATKTVRSARVSFARDQTPTTPERDTALLRALARDGHWSPFRHSPITLHISAPEFVARQWWKHVVGGPYSFLDTGWNEVSQRYTAVADYYVPAEFHDQSTDRKQGSAGTSERSAEMISRYQSTMNNAWSLYDDMLKAGISREEARMVLPLSVYTRWYWTPSQQAAFHFTDLRIASTAQSHIRMYAEAVRTICQQHYGIAWTAFEEARHGTE